MNTDSRDLIFSVCHDAVKETLKTHYIKHSRQYTADYFKDSGNVSYGAYLKDNLLEIIETAVTTGIISYHDILSTLLHDKGIDLDTVFNNPDSAP